MLIIYQMSHNAKKRSAWQNVISPHLLEFLFVSGNKQRSRTGTWLTGLVTILTIIAISGPSLRQKSVPVFQTENAQVILLDLSLSMDATDIKPSRLERAKFKLLDLLEQTKEGTVALVVYAGDAFVISPLTSDAKTIANMVPTLSTGIMPVLGSRPDIAMKKSIELLENAKYSQGQIIWLTDGVEPKFVDTISESIRQSKFSLSILAIGTEQGAPIPLPDKSGFLKDQSGSIVVPKLQTAELNDIASATDSGIIQLTADESDIQYLKDRHQWQKEDATDSASEQLISRWIDDGYWIIWLVLALFLIKIIRQPVGQTLSILSQGMALLLFTSIASHPAQAIGWKDLWQTKNQQANQAYQEGEYEEAAKLYQDKEWQAAAHYKNGSFAEAASGFNPDSSPQSLYNHATSLAKANHLQEALDGYDKLLEQEPEHEDALFNKKIIEDLLKQQQEQQDQQSQEQDSDQENQDQQSQDQDSQSQEQQSDQDSQQQQQQEQDSEQSEQQAEQKNMEISEDERDKSEKDQALEHWLQKIPDDPGGLLRRKMYREYQRRGRQQKEEKLW